MEKLPILQTGDTVELIAPASRCSDQHLMAAKALLNAWGLHCIIDPNIFGNDILCANSDEIRFNSLKAALLNTETKAVICARGGYGSMRLIPKLATLTPPKKPKLFVGMSDITALNLYLHQHWQWPILHGALAPHKSTTTNEVLKSILMAETEKLEFEGIALNALAKQSNCIETTITGGNLCLIQSSIGTLWQMDGQNKMILLEEVAERGYRVDRMLEHLRQTHLFRGAKTIIFGDFVGGLEPKGHSLIRPVLERFADSCNIPVVQVPGIGHGFTSFPIPMGTKAKLQLGETIQLICYR